MEHSKETEKFIKDTKGNIKLHMEEPALKRLKAFEDEIAHTFETDEHISWHCSINSFYPLEYLDKDYFDNILNNLRKLKLECDLPEVIIPSHIYTDEMFREALRHSLWDDVVQEHWLPLLELQTSFMIECKKLNIFKEEQLTMITRGLVYCLDVAQYCNPLFGVREMEYLFTWLYRGYDISLINNVNFTIEIMRVLVNAARCNVDLREFAEKGFDVVQLNEVLKAKLLERKQTHK